jgi:hypothetical protein
VIRAEVTQTPKVLISAVTATVLSMLVEHAAKPHLELVGTAFWSGRAN